MTRVPVGLLALIAGLALGIVAVRWDGAAAVELARWVEPVGLIWVNAIRMTVIPLIVATLIVAVSGSGLRTMGRLGSRLFLIFVLLLVVVAVFAVVAAPPVFDLLEIGADTAQAIQPGIGSAVAQPAMPSFTSWLVGIVPVNPMAAAAEGAMLPLVVFSLVFGLALGRIDPARREAVVGFFQGVADAITVVIGWVLAATPVGVFALAFVLAARTGTEIVGAAGFYLVAYAVLLLAATLLVYLVLAIFGKVPLMLFARAALPAQLVAVTTRSSLAALPAMATSAEETLRLPGAVTSFALPVAVSTFRLNQPVSWVVMALFAAQLYGVELGTTAVITLAITAVLMSFSVPGIPSASLFVVAPFFAGVGIPPEAIGMLIALDLLPDVFKTLLNVTGHLGAVTLVRSEK